MEDLESQLQQGKDARLRLIISDGAFSMDGKIAPLKWATSLFVHSQASLQVGNEPGYETCLQG